MFSDILSRGWRVTVILICLSALPTVCGSAFADPGATTLDADFEALAAYEFGQSRAPLQRISEAVRAAAARLHQAPDAASALERRLLIVLEGPADYEAKRFVCRMLGEIGGDAAITALSRALDDDALFDTALTALETIPGETATTQMVNALQTAGPDRTIAIIAALGRRADPKAAAPLLQYLGDENTETAEAAARAMASLAAPDACRMMLNAMNAATPEARTRFADAALRCADVFVEAGDAAAALAVLDMLDADELPVFIRVAALSQRMRLTPAQAQNLLLDALQDPDPRMAAEVLMLTRLFPEREVTAALTAQMVSATPERQAALLAVLEERGDDSALPEVVRMLDHEQPEVRSAALHATGALGDAALTTVLLERATAGRIQEQRTARQVLARLKDPDTDAQLLAVAAGHGEDSVRMRAIALLAERRAGASANTLLQLAEEGPAPVRAEAVRALRTLATPEMLHALVNLARKPDPADVSNVLPQTLAQTAERLPDHADKSAAVIAGLSSADSAETRIIFLDALGLIGGDNAFKAVCAALETRDIETRRAAVAALARFQNPDALDVLRTLVLHERDDALRGRAYTAYLALIRDANVLSLQALTPHLQCAFEQARTPAERRDFLATASRIPARKTLRMIEPWIEEEEVAAEALHAAAHVASAIAGAWPEDARKRLESIAAQDHAPDLAEQARRALSLMQRFEGHIMAWEVAGPYYEEHVFAESLFDHVFPPETDAETANWRVLPLLPDADPPYALELDRVLGGDDRVAYLRTRIQAPETRDAVLELGTNDGCRVWWNGELLYSLNIGRALTPGEDKLPIQLKAGMNELMIAVFQHGAAWRATARIISETGEHIPALTYYPGAADSE